jgi:hypothetical protein
MYRHRTFVKVRDLEGWNEVVRLAGVWDALCERLGTPKSSLWTESFGPFNNIVMETEYASLAEYEAATQKLYADPEALELSRALGAVTLAEAGHTELWEQATGVGAD